MGDVVVAPDLLLAAGAPDALDHRIVVERVGEDEAIRQQAGDGRDAGEIGDPARGEDERRLLAVQVGELALEHDDRMMGAGNVAGAAGAGAVGARRLDARLDDVGVAAHAEIVVRAPDGDFGAARALRPAGAIGRAGSGRRRARDRRRRDSALRASDVRSPPQNDADNPSAVDPSSRPPGWAAPVSPPFAVTGRARRVKGDGPSPPAENRCGGLCRLTPAWRARRRR